LCGAQTQHKCGKSLIQTAYGLVRNMPGNRNMFVTNMRGTTYLVFPHSTSVTAFNKTANKGIKIERLIRSENGITGWYVCSLHIENSTNIFKL
jgi:hypothetical protein